MKFWNESSLHQNFPVHYVLINLPTPILPSVRLITHHQITSAELLASIPRPTNGVFLLPAETLHVVSSTSAAIHMDMLAKMSGLQRNFGKWGLGVSDAISCFKCWCCGKWNQFGSVEDRKCKKNVDGRWRLV